MNELYDVAIVGAGPAGSAAAHYLAGGGLNVLLLDKFDFPRDKTCGDGLTPRALRILDEMGILDELLREGYRLKALEVIAPNGHTASAPVSAHGDSLDYMLIVRRLVLDNVILQRAMASGAHFASPVRVTDIQQGTSSVTLQGESRAGTVSYDARLAIVATGANIALLSRAGMLKKPPTMILATRTYYDGMANLYDLAQCRFDGVPLPGYGWVFPLSDSSANVGSGFFRTRLTSRWMPDNARQSFDAFVQTPPLQEMLRTAHRTGPIKGYPLRVDFASAPTFHGRVMLAGEAAGLVNPVTGEGIDYALESGKLAAEHLLGVFSGGNLTQPHFEAYDHTLRERYQRLFVLCNRLRLLYLNPFVLNRVVRSAAGSAELTELFMNIVFENQDAYKALSPSVLLKAMFGAPHQRAGHPLNERVERT